MHVRLILVCVFLLSACESAPAVVPTPAETITALPTNTAAPAATDTPLTTKTVIPSVLMTTAPASTPIPAIVPGIRLASAQQLPPIAHDLLFLNRDGLMRWNHTTSRIEPLVTATAPYSAPASFSLSADGQRVAFAHSNTLHEDEIALLDLRSGQSTLLARFAANNTGYGTTGLFQMAISPDGKWVAYMRRGTFPVISNRIDDQVEPTFTQAGDAPPAGMIYALRTDMPDRRLDIGYCAAERVVGLGSTGCQGFIWSADSRFIVWGDGRGVWHTALGYASASQLAPDSAVSPYQQGPAAWHLQAWSPLGRYVLGSVWSRAGASLEALDTRTHVQAVISDTLGLTPPRASATWLQDGRLFVLKPADGKNNTSPIAEFWKIETLQQPLRNVEMQVMREAFFVINGAAENVPVAPAQLADGRLVFGLLNSSAANYLDRGLYVVEPDERHVRKLNGLPPTKDEPPNVNVFWSPDGAGALVHATNESVLYVPSDGSVLLDFTSVLGNTPCCFVWVR